MPQPEKVIAEQGNIRLRAMRDDPAEYERIVRWRNTPHVREWWDPDDPPMTVEQAMEDLRPGILGADPERYAIVEVAGRPAGFIQYYPWAPFAAELREMGLSVPDGAWGLDLYIGEPEMVNRGTGSTVVRMLCDHLFAHEGATAVAFGTELTNARARRAYEKAGMREVTEYLDTDTRNGERVRSIFLMRMVEDGSA